MPHPLSGRYSTNKVAVIGFPGERNGEKWGMVAETPIDKKNDWNFGLKEILVCNFIDTSPGQSGSSVLGMIPRDVIRVRTGGKAALKKNWAT